MIATDQGAVNAPCKTCGCSFLADGWERCRKCRGQQRERERESLQEAKPRFAPELDDEPEEEADEPEEEADVAKKVKKARTCGCAPSGKHRSVCSASAPREDRALVAALRPDVGAAVVGELPPDVGMLLALAELEPAERARVVAWARARWGL